MEHIKRIAKNSKLLTKGYRIFYGIFSTVFWNIRFLINRLLKQDEIYGCCFVFTTLLGRVRKNNWGDDLNEYLFTALTQKKISFVPFDKLYFFPNVERYSLIGSIIGDFNLDNTIIYGSGAITSNPELKGRPKKVLSVRGPLSREVLLKNGVQCPAIYGDPALLVPFIYSPQTKKENKIGVIPHYRTLKSNWIELLEKENEVLIIDMSKYKKWTDIIDSIASCKIILSESLHGLIIAESYEIPSLWVEFIPHSYSWEWEFKFIDFYKSIGKNDPQCYKIYNGYDTEEILDKVKEWMPGNIDYDSMIKAFPFELKGALRR